LSNCSCDVCIVDVELYVGI